MEKDAELRDPDNKLKSVGSEERIGTPHHEEFKKEAHVDDPDAHLSEEERKKIVSYYTYIHKRKAGGGKNYTYIYTVRIS